MPAHYEQIRAENIARYAGTRPCSNSSVSSTASGRIFIFELIQNADDADATQMTFELRRILLPSVGIPRLSWAPGSVCLPAFPESCCRASAFRDLYCWTEPPTYARSSGSMRLNPLRAYHFTLR